MGDGIAFPNRFNAWTLAENLNQNLIPNGNFKTGN